MLYRDIRFNLGSATDIMGATGTVTGATFNKDKKGWALQTGSGKYVQYNRQLLPNGAFSVVVWAKIKDGPITGADRVSIISNVSGNGDGIKLAYSAGIRYACFINGVNNYRYFNYIANKKWNCYIFTIPSNNIDSINNSLLYVNNELKPVYDTIFSGAPLSRSNYTYISTGASSQSSGVNISRIKVYDHVLTPKEREREQTEFEAAQPLTYQKRLLSLPKPTELKQSGILAGYNKIRSGVYNDLSISGKHGVVTNCLSTVKGIKLHGVNSKVVLGNIGNVKSISFRIKLATTTQPILEKAINSGLIYVSGGTLTSLDFANKYVNGVVGTTITANQWHNVTITSTTDVNFSAATLGLNNTTYGNFEIEDLRFYSTTLSLQEIKAYHNSFNEVILHEKFEDIAVGSSKLPNGWIKNGGSFVCAESTTNDPVIKSIRKGTKYLRCVTAGIVAIPCKQSYCTWEFSWYKGGELNQPYFSFINSKIIDTFNGAGYSLHIQNNEAIRLIKSNLGSNLELCLTASSYITINTWYRVRITRTTSGTFTIYILGGNFTSWTLVSTIGGGGTNPVVDVTYNTSNYFVIDLDQNDRFSDLLITNQIKI